MGTAVVGNDVKTIEQQDTRSHNNIFQQRKAFASNLCKKKGIAGSGEVCAHHEKREIQLFAIYLIRGQVVQPGVLAED